MELIINKESASPIYKQISNQIKYRIITEELMENDVLPTIRALSKSLNVSHVTVHKAYEDLQHEGYIYTTIGYGTVVSGKGAEFRKRIIKKKLAEVVKLALIENTSLEELIRCLEALYNKS